MKDVIPYKQRGMSVSCLIENLIYDMIASEAVCVSTLLFSRFKDDHAGRPTVIDKDVDVLRHFLSKRKSSRAEDLPDRKNERNRCGD